MSRVPAVGSWTVSPERLADQAGDLIPAASSSEVSVLAMLSGPFGELRNVRVGSILLKKSGLRRTAASAQAGVEG
jgi:hypothetical protein